MNEKSLTLASIFAAFAASLCCLGPLVLGAAGVGAALTSTFAPLRPYFLALASLLLGAGFYSAYRKPKVAEACAGPVCAPQSRVRRLAKPLLWLAAIVVAALALFPMYESRLVGGSASRLALAPAAQATAELRISGMTCEVCAAAVQRRLRATPGVVGARVEYPSGQATVQYDPAKVDAAGLVGAVKEAGYRAEVTAPPAMQKTGQERKP